MKHCDLIEYAMEIETLEIREDESLDQVLAEDLAFIFLSPMQIFRVWIKTFCYHYLRFIR